MSDTAQVEPTRAWCNKRVVFNSTGQARRRDRRRRRKALDVVRRGVVRLRDAAKSLRAFKLSREYDEVRL